MYTLYQQYDVILYNKMHHNYLFKDSIKNKLLTIDFNKNYNGTHNSRYIKTRPAIILKRFSNYNYLIIPLTTKINKNIHIQELYRTHFKKWII